MDQSIYSEKDSKINCQNYPNNKFKSYVECDEEFVYNFFKNKTKLMPFWVSKEGMGEITKFR